MIESMLSQVCEYHHQRDVIPAQGEAGVSAWTQAACATVRACKPGRALQGGIQVVLIESTWIPAFAGMTRIMLFGKVTF